MDGFFDDGRLKKISVDGGSAVTLCEAPAGRGASWGKGTGNIILSPDINRGLVRVLSAGGTPVPVTKLKPGEFTHRWPRSCRAARRSSSPRPPAQVPTTAQTWM